jgi:hypothetical protein
MEGMSYVCLTTRGNALPYNPNACPCIERAKIHECAVCRGQAA